MELSEVAEELYSASPDDFMELRTAQAAAAKAEGNKELAKQIGQLRKPTRSAWLVNLLARKAPDAVSELLEIGNALRDAQQNLDGAELRRLSTARHRAVDALSRQAADLGGEEDYTATEAVRQEVSQTLQAALADPEQAELVQRGTLSQAVTYGGFGPFEITAPAPTRKSATTAPKKDAEADTGPDEQAAREARGAWELARDQLAEAEEEAERTTADADKLADQVDELRQQLQAAEKAEHEARRTARTARKRLDEVTATERSARQAAEDTRP